MTENQENLEALESEINESRETFDLIGRLTQRPKRDPEVVTVYLNDQAGQKLGYARDVRDEYGNITRQRAGVLGEIDKLASAVTPDEKAIKRLEREAKKLVAEIKKDSLTFTLQWIPPIAEEVIERDAINAVGLKSKPVPKEKIEEFKHELFARLLVDTLVELKDNASGAVMTSMKIHEAQRLRELLPPAQFDRLDTALGKLQYTSAIYSEAVDNADF